MEEVIKMNNNPDLILTADLHLRSTIPICRKDDFLKEQERKIDFILRKSHLHQCPILIAGDIGDKPQWENWLLEKYIRKFKTHSQKIYVLPGQHDLPNHRLDKLPESGLGVLAASLAIKLLFDPMIYAQGIEIFPFPFGKKTLKIEEYQNKKFGKSGGQNIAIIHQLVSQTKLWKGQENFVSAKSLLKKFPEYDLIVSGDNHQSFIEEYKGRLLVNPGSIMRSTIGQINHKPKIYLWYAETNTVIECFIPIKKDVFRPTEEIIELEERNTDLFIQTIIRDYDVNISFEKNMERCFNKNPDLPKKVKDRIYKAMGI